MMEKKGENWGKIKDKSHKRKVESGARVRRCKGTTVRRYDGAMVQRYKGARVQLIFYVLPVQK
jgi:hypothetical protein